MRIYLSGPMTGLPNYNHDEFNRVVSELLEAGHEVFNPAWIQLSAAEMYKINSIKDEKERARELWKAYMKVCTKNLPDYDCLVMLDGWLSSRGATLEWKIATMLGMKIVEFDKLEAGQEVI